MPHIFPYDIAHKKWKAAQKKDKPFKRLGFYDRCARALIKDWDRRRREKKIAAAAAAKKVNRKKYLKKRKQYRRLKTRMVEGRRMLTTYNLKAFPKTVFFEDLHLSEYAGKEELLDVLCGLRKGQVFSVPEYIAKKWLQRRWWQPLPDYIKKLVHVRWLSRKFWTKPMLDYVRTQVIGRIPLNDVAAGIYNLYYHRIRTVTLAKMAYRFGWIKPTGPPW